MSIGPPLSSKNDIFTQESCPPFLFSDRLVPFNTGSGLVVDAIFSLPEDFPKAAMSSQPRSLPLPNPGPRE